MRNSRIIFRIALLVLFIVLAIYATTVKLGQRARDKYTVRGVDVSAYQGTIDWEEIENNGISFAFIKATEGSSFKDKRFHDNIENIKYTNIAAGAYHFMSFESSGKAQAENFISEVDKEMLSLPPVIDLELYGNYHYNPPDAEKVREILSDMVTCLYEEYGVMPIIYTNARSYSLYVSGEYKDCDIWICDIIKKPVLPDHRSWTFWQYSHTGKMTGYDGDEEYIDMNVFCGTQEEFEDYKS